MSLFSRTPFDKGQIEAAICRLEQITSAELRVYIERHKPQEADVFNYALNVFYSLEMDKTEANNAVLIYLAYKDHQCAVIGDKGIHQYVGDDFWQQNYTLMSEYFKQNQYTEGLVAAIDNIGKRLAQHFPIQVDDQNELANEVIIHD